MTATATATATVARGDTRAEARSSSWWSDTLVFAGRNLRHVKEIPEKLLDVTVQPLMFTLLFAFVFGGAIAVDGGSYREYLVGGILIQTIAFGMMGPATAMATDLTEGVIDRFRALPSRRSSYLSGHVLAELAGMGVAVSILLATGLLVGWRVHTDVAHVLVALALLTLFAAGMVWVGTFIGLSVRTPDAVMGIGFTAVFPLTFVSNAFVPAGSMPSALQTFAAWNPVSVLVAAVRELFGNPAGQVDVTSWPLEHPVVAAFLYCGVILAVAVPVCLACFQARTTD